MLTHGSLFAGIGGFDLGFERAGFKTVWQVEIDPYCRAVLAKHFPGAERFEDVREVGAHNLKPVGVISGGFPCQPFSHAGRRGGSADNRHLWPEMFRVVHELRPTYVVAENVRGFISLDDGRYLDTVYANLEGEGYEILPPLVLPASAFGAPHRRDRCWILAHCRHDGWSAEQEQQQEERAEESYPGGKGDVADPNGPRLEGWHGAIMQKRSSELPIGARRTRWNHWEVEPDVGRVADGIPRRVDRLKCLGNAVVPQIAQWIAERILENENAQ